jgi:hypothetical protein
VYVPTAVAVEVNTLLVAPEINVAPGLCIHWYVAPVAAPETVNTPVVVALKQKVALEGVILGAVGKTPTSLRFILIGLISNPFPLTSPKPTINITIKKQFKNILLTFLIYDVSSF